MKKAFLLLLCWVSHTAYAQPDQYKSYPELRGSGKLVREDRQTAPFQTVKRLIAISGRETYPIGTKIEQLDPNQRQVAMTGGNADGKLIITLKASDNGRTYNSL